MALSPACNDLFTKTRHWERLLTKKDIIKSSEQTKMKGGGSHKIIGKDSAWTHRNISKWVDEDEGSPSRDGVNWAIKFTSEWNGRENRQISGSPPGEPSLVYLSLQIDSPLQDWPATVQVKSGAWRVIEKNRKQIIEKSQNSDHPVVFDTVGCV